MEKTQENLNPRIPTNLRPIATNLILFVVISVLFSAISGAKTVSAASLYFSPSSGKYAVGSTLSVNVYVSSADQTMNAASGIISFPQDKLKVTSLSKSGSIFTLWVQKPSFSNDAGAVNFEGMILNPGFMEAKGKIITINFRVKAAGNALLNFSSGSALANDGKGTNILASLGNAKFSLGGVGPTIPKATEKKTTPKTASTPVSKVPALPQVSSSTHSDSNQWYNNKNPRFSWTLPHGVNGVSIDLNENPTSNPGLVSDGLSASKNYENIGDGIWYFHIKMRNSAGWGPIAHFKIQIDTQPPEQFAIKFIDGTKTENPRPTVVFDTTDSLSGVNYYKIKIGEGEFFSASPEIVKSNPYTLPLQNSGKRNILVQAFDNAENYSVATEEFTIEPLQTPVFTEYPKKLQSDQALTVKGKTKYPNSQIIIWLQREKDDPKSFAIESDEDGKFTFTADEKLRDGIYQLWAKTVDSRGAKSLPSEKITIAVAMPAIFRIGTWAISFLAVVVPLVALIIMLLFIIWHGWHKFSLLRNRLKKEVREAEKINKQLKKDLDDAEKSVRKEIEDIEREVK